MLSRSFNKSPASRRLEDDRQMDLTPFQEARRKFVIGSPVMHHAISSPRAAPFFVRNSDLSSTSTPKSLTSDAKRTPVVRWLLQEQRSWTASNNLSMEVDNGLLSPTRRSDDSQCSSERSEKCYSLTYHEESAATTFFEDNDQSREEEDRRTSSSSVSGCELMPEVDEPEEVACKTLCDGRFADESRLRQLDDCVRPCKFMTWSDPKIASALKRMVLSVAGLSGAPAFPMVVHPLNQMIQFKVHPPAPYSSAPSSALTIPSPSPVADLVARIINRPHSHVKLTLPNGEKLQIITQGGLWTHGTKAPFQSENSFENEVSVEDNRTATERHVCKQCHLLAEQLKRQNQDFRQQIRATEIELDAIRERLTVESQQMQALEGMLEQERETHAELRIQFDKMKQQIRPPWTSSPLTRERKRPVGKSLLLFDKSKIAKKARSNLPMVAAHCLSDPIKRMKAPSFIRSAISGITQKKSLQFNPITETNTDDTSEQKIRELQEALDLSIQEKEELCSSVQQLRSSAFTEHQQRALENELIHLREKNKLLTESYQAEKLARKRFFSMLEDAKGKIRVYCRIKPLLPNETSNILDCVDDFTVTLNGVRGRQEFQFDHVFTSKHTQEDVFGVAQDMITLAYDGYNVCIFAYGQTGSGKTHTLLGDPHGKDPGIASRAFLKLFDLVTENDSRQETAVHISALELYNDKLLDLLHPQGQSEEKLEIRKESNGMVYVLGCKSKRVDKPSSLLAVFYEACARRHVASTKMNSRSSRSHLIVTLLVESTNKLSGTITRGKFSLVDLAGSERQSKSDTVLTQLKEANSINKSLSALGDVIAALASEQPHVPYRNNKLTQLMQDSLGGNAKTLMFVNVSSAKYNLEETSSSLQYAARVKQIKNDPSRMTESKEIARLKAIISKLRKGDILINET